MLFGGQRIFGTQKKTDANIVARSFAPQKISIATQY